MKKKNTETLILPSVASGWAGLVLMCEGRAGHQLGRGAGQPGGGRVPRLLGLGPRICEECRD